MKIKGNIRNILVTILMAVVIFLGMNFSLQSRIVSGRSMEPSFHNGEWFLLDKLSYHFKSPGRGDVIVFYPPNNLSEPYIKRIIGLPGEHIEINEGRIFISNDEGDFKLVEKTDLPAIPYSDEYSGIIPEDSYFVLGDNRSASNDSRYFGPVSEDTIIGKALICYWPPSELGLSPGYSATLEDR